MSPTTLIERAKSQKISKRALLNIFGVLLFATLFVNFPYVEIRGGQEFVDLFNYERTFSGKSMALKRAGESIKGYVSNEVLWDFTVRQIMSLFSLGPLSALKWVSFFVVVATVAYVRRGAGWLWLFLLFNPLFIDLVMSQCRSAFAVSLFYIALLSKKKSLVILATVLSIFVHTSMVAIAAFYWIGWWLFRGGKLGKKPLLAVFSLIGMGVFLGLLMGPLQNLIAGFIAEDRRAGQYGEIGSSLAYSSFWLALIPVFAFIKPKFNRVPNNAFALTMLSVFAVTVVFDLYGSRFVAMAFPCILCAIYRLDPILKNWVTTGLIAFTCVQWWYWL